MPTDPALWIMIAVFVGAIIGFFACALFSSGKFRKLEKRTWDNARAYYERKHDPAARRL